jgi:uncharacterized delta-60 repeat protein
MIFIVARKMMTRWNKIFLLAVSISAPAWATSWKFTLPSSASGNFQAQESKHGVNISGTYLRQSNGFIKQTIGSCSAEDSSCPALGATKFTLEVPSFALFSPPTLQTETQITSAIVSGACPTTPWSGIWVPSLWSPSGEEDVTSDRQTGFGTFTWYPATSTLTITSLYNLSQGQFLGGNFPLPGGTCSNGVITLTGAGDRGGTMYITADQGGIYHTSANHAFFIVPQIKIPNVNVLNGTYSAFNYDSASAQTINPLKLTISAGTIQGNSYLDVESDTIDPSQTWSITNIAINTPIDGMFRGDLSRAGSAATKVACILYVTSKSVLFCAAQSTSLPQKPMNFSVVSNVPAFPSGSLDTYSFGNGAGYSRLIMGGSLEDTYANTMAIQPDGKIVLGGKTNLFNSQNNHFLVARFNPDGSVDTSFNSGASYGAGKILLDVGGINEYVSGLALQPDGKIVVGGSSDYDFAIVRLNSDGSIDSSFAPTSPTGAGKLRVNFGLDVTGTGGSRDTMNALAVQPDGKIVAVGYTEALGTGAHRDFAVIRINPDGSIDSTFGAVANPFGAGRVALDIEGTSPDWGNAVALQSDGKIVLGGYCLTQTYPSQGQDMVVARLNADGTLDTSFNAGGPYPGKNVVKFNEGAHEKVNALTIQPNGSIVAAGHASGGFGVARFRSTGELDPSFNPSGALGAGKQTISLSGTADVAYGAAIQIDGKIVVTGYSQMGGYFGFGVTRLNTNGTLDTTYNTGSAIGAGKQAFRLGPYDHTYATSVAIQSDGKLVFGAETNVGGGFDLAVFRLWP